MRKTIELSTTSTLVALAALLGSGAVSANAPASAPQFRVAVPQGFDNLAAEQHAVLDVFMGGKRVTTSEAIFAPGQFRFVDPAALVAALPGLTGHGEVLAALAVSNLADNRTLACSDRVDGAACQPLRPAVAGVVFDERRFRVEVFVAPALLETHAAVSADFLAEPERSLSFIHSLGASFSGTAGEQPRLALMDSVQVGLGPARLRADFGWQSGQQAWSDQLAIEADRHSLRATGGLFWVPGTELTGRRKLLGMSVRTQFDTRLDRDQLQGTPLVVHLDERSRVDTWVGGRLVSSGLFDAGNQALDTSDMPEGSYEVVLRITAARGGTREERRLFTRNPTIPPMGHDAWALSAGALVDDSRGGFPFGRITRTPYVEARWLHRLAPRWAMGLGVLGTDQRQLVQATAMLAGRQILANATLVTSVHGDFGVYAHLGSQPGGRLSFNLDARATASRDGRPLLPETTPTPVWVSGQPQFSSVGHDVTQASGDVAWQFGRARLALVGAWRRADGQDQYAVGPSMRLPILRGDGFELMARGDYALTERGRSGYVGLSLQLARGNKSYSAEAGLSRAAGSPSAAPVATGSLRATIADSTRFGEVQANASVLRDESASYATADLSLRGSRGELSASVGQALGGAANGMQYALSLRTGLNGTGGRIALGRADGGEAAVIARVDAAPDERFDLLVNDVPRASLRGGHTVSIDLPAYRAYDVRLRAAATSLLGYDGATRRVTLYPGSVASFAWTTRPQLAIYARLVDPNGKALSHAAISAARNVADSGEDGGFLIQLDAERSLVARLPDGSTCTARVPVSVERTATNGFASLTTLACEP